MAPPVATIEPMAPPVTNSFGHKNEGAPAVKSPYQSRLDPNYTIVEQPIGTRRPLRIVCLGAGYSGLMMGIVHNERMKSENVEFVMYERNPDIGGTWYENR